MPPPPDGKDKGEAGESPALTRNCNWVTPEARTTAQSRMCPLAMMGKYSVYIVNLALWARFFLFNCVPPEPLLGQEIFISQETGTEK